MAEHVACEAAFCEKELRTNNLCFTAELMAKLAGELNGLLQEI